MPGPVHFMEFRTPEGVVIQRLDSIQTILEAKGKGGETTFFLIVGQNVKIQVLDETRESIRQRLNGAGTNMVVVPLPEEPPEPVMDPGIPVGNAVALPEPEIVGA